MLSKMSPPPPQRKAIKVSKVLLGWIPTFTFIRQDLLVLKIKKIKKV